MKASGTPEPALGRTVARGLERREGPLQVGRADHDVVELEGAVGVLLARGGRRAGPSGGQAVEPGRRVTAQRPSRDPTARAGQAQLGGADPAAAVAHREPLPHRGRVAELEPRDLRHAATGSAARAARAA